MALLGGSFDPPTISHIQIAAEIYNNFEDICEVWMIPCGDGREDKKLTASGEHRREMLKILLDDILGNLVPVKLNDIEIKNKQYFPTVELLNNIKKENPGKNFTFCMGTDLVPTLKKWEGGKKLVNNQDFIIIRRPGYEPDLDEYPKHYRFLSANVEGSSTKVRNRIKEQIEKKMKVNLGISGLTTKRVIDYINELGLYKD